MIFIVSVIFDSKYTKLIYGGQNKVKIIAKKEVAFLIVI